MERLLRTAALGTGLRHIDDLCAGERVRQDMLQIGQARSGYDYVTGLLGKDALLPVHSGWMPNSDALLASIS